MFFQYYRREKAANDNVLKEQINQYRDEASSTRLDNAKLVSKVNVLHVHTIHVIHEVDVHVIYV